jgi:hypothetical protein
MAIEESLPLGVVLERRRSNHPWQDFVWRPVGVFPGAADRDPAGEWTLLREGDGWAQYHAGTLRLSLFRRETDGYLLALSQEPPRLFLVLRTDDLDAAHEVTPFLVTASPVEAQEYLDGSDVMVEPVDMPPGVIGFVRDFVERHHVDVPFEKRKRKRASLDRAAPRGRSGDRHG